MRQRPVEMLKLGMARKSISKETEKQVLLKSRRRCCLCYWHDGVVDVQKGQIAHLDQNNQNAQESNLVFLCFDHHDEYDGKTRIAKGLTESEVKAWRDELYADIEHKFGSRTTVNALGLKLEEGNNLFYELEDDAEFQQWKIDAAQWETETEALIEKGLPQADLSLFRSAPPPSATRWEARFNREHNSMLSALTRRVGCVD